MAFPSVTNTFTNGSTADATQVNQNFTDIINGISDTTKDISVNNATFASTVTANGNVVLGSSTSKTITINGSIASSIPVSANNSWDFGSATLGMKSIYLGASGGFTTRILAAATSSWSMTLPVTGGSNGQVLTTDGSGNTSWQPIFTGPDLHSNYSVSTSVNSNAMTINLLDGSGANPSATSPASISFRNTTSATGIPQTVQVTGALNVVVASGATLGHTSGVDQFIYLWAMNNAGTIELVVSGSRNFDEGILQSSTAMSGSATDWQTLYGTSGRANKPIRLLGRIRSNQTVAGTYAANSTEISLSTNNSWPTFTNWNSTLIFTFSAGFGTTSNYAVLTKRIGNSMWIKGSVTLGTVAASVAQIIFPSGYALDNGIFTGSVGQDFNFATNLTTSSVGIYGNELASTAFYDGSDTTGLYFGITASSNAFFKTTGSGMWVSSTPLVFSIQDVPIKQWRSY